MLDDLTGDLMEMGAFEAGPDDEEEDKEEGVPEDTLMLDNV